ncbi:alpha/beta hydrolase [Dokdonella fugitiva]|jgi:pimeloyl-ACP methyl ester carboxylesterase|uniref:Alpha/beta hydrolase family protein n=1 Tax=Dokdonella fugitiva TaxID=328517 RepID=A0A4R2IEX8_9GAMM|nr:alpha/beta hydrolase [Dokdonella fugitiva]TCO43251.1 alpha/beta hydrolase family protein [Dokdonella fugitiva]
MDKRNLTRMAVVALGLAALAGKALWQRSHARPEEPGADIVQKAGERGFMLGSLAFEACELGQSHSAATTSAFCAPMQVPEDRAHPQGRRIALKLALARSTAPLAARDLVVLLAGGPGQAATSAWPGVRASFAPLLERRNVLLLDQRGTGGSNALTCARAADEGSDELPFDPGRVQATTRACLAGVAQHADPRFYTTTDAVADLEAVRAALGSPRFDLVGVSYGTRVAQQYALHHPEAIRSLVLDSAVPNDQALGSEFAINLDAALQAQFAACAADAACAKAVGDPWANLQRLRERLRAQPVDVAFRDPYSNAPGTRRLGERSLAALARMYAYLPETSALLPLAIARALDGDYASLAAQMRMLERQMEELSESAMQLSVVCSEDADRAVPNPADAGTLLGSEFVETLRAQCAIWPHGNRPADFTQPLRGDLPVLVIGGEFDPVTPPRYAERIASTLPRSRVLVAKGLGHSVMGRGCFPKLVARFVDTLDAAALDAGCIADFSATPAFIDYNGAAP